jgi:superfamily II DNA/RNA helicase
MVGSAATVVVAAIAAALEVHSWSSIPRRHAARRPAGPISSISISPSSSSSSSYSSSYALRAAAGDDDNELRRQLPSMGLNELQTQFRLAISREDMDAASLYRDELADRVSSGAYRAASDDEEEDASRKRRRLNWGGLGTAPWLIERLQALDYPLPTTIQINAFEAVNAILLHDVDGRGLTSSRGIAGNVDDDTLEERLRSQLPQNMGVVISGSTGSGKTLAYLVPALSTLSQTLFTRQRIRIKDEEDVDDLMGDLIDRVMVQTSPSVRGQGYDQVVGGKGGGITSATAALSSLGKSGTDIKSPVALIVVPTRELGVQIALLLYELVGGNTKKTALERSGRRNMFKVMCLRRIRWCIMFYFRSMYIYSTTMCPAFTFQYKGPKGVKIGCVLDEVMSKEGLKLQTDIAITTPKYLSKLIDENDVDPSKLRVVIFDEADLGLEQTSDANLKLLFDNNETGKREFSRISYLVGASVTESLGNLAVKGEILPEGKSFIATATRFAPIAKDDEQPSTDDAGTTSSPEDSMTTLKDLRLCLDPGLRHERVLVSDNSGLLCLARMLRKELREYEIANATLAESPDTSGDSDMDDLMKQLAVLREDTKDLEEDFGIDSVFDSARTNSINVLQRPRVVVFFPDEDEARDATFLLRDALWGEHRLGVLLPKTGENPLTIMEAFKYGDISVLLATPNSIRGLDFPALTHVYTLFLPADDPREYLHLAGRVGRIGQQGSVRGQGGRVTTILDQNEASQFDKLAEFLGFDFDDVAPIQAEVTNESNVEDMRRYLEDTMTLLGTADASRDEPRINFTDVVDEPEDTEDDDEDEEGRTE